jgi:hypothetical protein
MYVNAYYWMQWKGKGHLINSYNFASKDNVDVGPRPRDLRLGKESKNKELEKRMDWWEEKEITCFCYSWSNL